MRKAQQLLLAVTALGCAVPVLVACGGGSSNQPPPNGSYQTWQANQPPPGQPGYAGGPATGAPPPGYGGAPAGYGGQPAGGPAPGPTMTGSPTPTATAAPTASVPPEVVTTLMSGLAAKYAPGMQPEGAPVTAQLAEGGKTSTTVTMTGGKCYTIIGASPPAVGVKDLSIELLVPPLYTLSGGKADTKSNEAVIGKAPNPTCPLTPLPIPYRLDITAIKGAGPVAVQVYSKSK